MNSTPTPADAAGHFARCLDAILAPLAVLVAARVRLIGQLTFLLCNRINRANRRLTSLLANLAAGRIATPRTRAPHRGGPPPIRLPARRAWLVILLRHEAAVFMLRLETALNDPATSALLAANPEAARRISRTLSPLCHLLGVTNPHAPPRAPRPRRITPRAAAIPAAQKSPTPRTSRTAPLARTTEGYLIPQSASPPAWPPIARLAPNLLATPPPATRSRDHPPASPSRGTRLR